MGKESKPPITLCDLLGLEMDSRLGLYSVGRLPALEVAFLHQGSSAHPFFGDHCARVCADDSFHPSPAIERNKYFFDFAEVDSRDSSDLLTASLLAMLPRLADIPELRFTYLKCDYLALHDDLTMKGHDFLYSMAILLSAPHGCNLVTGGEHRTQLQPGDVVIIDDQVKHGVYPLSKPEVTAEYNLATIQESQQESFVDRNCLSFLLICAAQVA